jgi:Rieske 2Fe-2S family protein
MSGSNVHYTLTGHEYRSMDTFDRERERIFSTQWFYAARSETVTRPEDRLVIDVLGESVLVVRDRDGVLRAFFNVCRHRGAQLCDPGETGAPGGITCPYHAWSYSLDGRLIGTPHVGKDEVDRAAMSLWGVSVDEWEGFVFVNLAADPEPLKAWLGRQNHQPLDYEKYALGTLRTGHRTVSEVAANWKILIDNYNECLHCPKVHPELVELIPVYKTGSVLDPRRGDGGVALADGADSFTLTGRSWMPLLEGMGEVEANSYFGAAVFPNMFIDITGTSAIATTLIPRSPDHTTVVSEYLFRPEAVEDSEFDPSAVVEFSELVARQDYDVCERVQRGISSRAFTRGVYADKDSLAHEFNEWYRATMGEPAP